MAEDEDGDEGLRRRLRKARARQDEKIRRWDAGEYPSAAYEAATALASVVPVPPGYIDSWPKHVEDKVREAIDAGGQHDAQALVEKLRAGLETDARRLRGYGTRFDALLKQNRIASPRLTRVSDMLRQQGMVPSGMTRVSDMLRQQGIVPSGMTRVSDILRQQRIVPSGLSNLNAANLLRASRSAAFEPIDFASLVRDMGPVVDRVVAAGDATLEHVQEDVVDDQTTNDLLREIRDAVQRTADTSRRTQAEAATDRRFTHAVAVVGILIPLLAAYKPHELRHAIDFLLQLLSQHSGLLGP